MNQLKLRSNVELNAKRRPRKNCTNNWISVSNCCSPKSAWTARTTTVEKKRKREKTTTQKPAHIRFRMFKCCWYTFLFFSRARACAHTIANQLIVSTDWLAGWLAGCLVAHRFIWSWIMRANLANRKFPIPFASSCVADLLLAAISPSSTRLSNSSNSSNYNQYMCTSDANDTLCADFLSVSRENTWRRAYDLVIYLFGARSMMYKTSFLILLFSLSLSFQFVSFLFCCFAFQCMRWQKRLKAKEKNANTMRTEANAQCTVELVGNYEWN